MLYHNLINGTAYKNAEFSRGNLTVNFSDTSEDRTFPTSPPSNLLQWNFLLIAIGLTTASYIEILNPSGLPTELHNIVLLIAGPSILKTATMLLID